MKKVVLKDYEKSKKMNHKNEFTFFDYIYHLTSKSNVNSDLLFAFLELFWPSFAVQGKYVFLKTNASKDKIVSLEKEGQNVEYWMVALYKFPRSIWGKMMMSKN